MVSEGRGRLFRRRDGKYLIYLPIDLAEDSMFPFAGVNSVYVRVSFIPRKNKLLIGKWTEPKQIPKKKPRPPFKRRNGETT